ncbi:uncharacterized protein LOC143662055 [Tamandua tetradactyla]|uniref:uncharacterized protein LOC143662055 n=1 Tax=Tamandua tetradactyla TaxID=48850 RepID=UPI0040548FA5
MVGKQGPHAVDIEQNTAELLPRNPYCSMERTYHCGCRFHTETLQPQQVTAKPWSLWKTFLVSLLACLIATTLVVLVIYFVHFCKPTNHTTSHSDGKSTHVTSTHDSTPLPLPGSQTILSSIPVTNQSSSTMVPSPAIETTQSATLDLEVIIEDDN